MVFKLKDTCPHNGAIRDLHLTLAPSGLKTQASTVYGVYQYEILDPIIPL